MAYYWILFFLLLILSFAAKSSPKTEKICLYLILLLVFVFFGFRIGFTPDYKGYEEWFASVNWNGYDFKDFRLSDEVVFSLIASFIPYRLGLILQAFLLCFALGYSLKKLIPVKYWSLAIILFFLYHYFILGNFSGYRSSFVTIAFFFAFIIRDRYRLGIIWGALLILASGLIHQAGILMIVPYLFCTSKKYGKRKYIIFFVVAAILITFMYTKVQEMNALATLLVEDNFRKFESYMDDMSGERSIHLTSLIYIYMFFYTASFLKKDISSLEHIFVFQTCIFIMLLIMPSIGMLDRFQYHYMFPAVVGFVIVTNYSKASAFKYAYLLSWGYLLVRSFYFFSHSETFVKYWAFYDNILFPF